jgi:hypothetical protein
MDIISFPLQFLASPPVRYLSHKYQDSAIVQRLWVDFALSKSDFRPCKFSVQPSEGDFGQIDFENCPTIWQIGEAIEQGSKVKSLGYVPEFIQDCFDNGILIIDSEGGKWGIRLIDFARANPHFFPSRQAKGGTTKGVNAEARAANKLADSVLPLFDNQPETVDIDKATVGKAHSLINQLRRAIGEPKMVTNHDPGDLKLAVAVVSEHDDEMIREACTFLVNHRDDPKVDKRIPVILRMFSSYKK